MRFRNMHRTGWNGPVRDWPRYGRVDELPEECEELRANYYALVQLCDSLLGELLDRFDREDLWKDTALVVTTDHGFLLGEHDFWAKNRMNMYEEIVHIPAAPWPSGPGTIDDSVSVLIAAAEGLGYAVVRWSLAATEIDRGRLVLASRRSVLIRYAYRFVCPEAYADLPKVEALRGWLVEEARAFPPPPGA